MKITSDIYQVGGEGLSNSADAAVYLVTSDGGAVLIDAATGKGEKQLLSNIKSCGVDPDSIKYLFLTHCHYDHTGGAAGIRKAAGCSIVAHSLDAKYIESGDSEVTAASWYGTYMPPLKVDVKVTGKSREFNAGGVKIVFHHTPGHSPGSSVLTTMSDGQLVLFGQDVHGPLDSRLLSNRADYRSSLEFMISLNADILCEGHFGVIKGKARVKSFIESYL